jgi:ferredoxin
MAETQERRLGGLTVVIERNLCIGSRNCVKLAPEVFVLDDEGIVTFRPDVPDIGRDRLVEACGICPVDALIAREGDRQLVP